MHISYDSTADIRLIERAHALESLSSARSRIDSVCTNIAGHSRDLESLASYPSAYTAEEAGEAFDAMLNETDLIREQIAMGRAAVKDLQQGDELMKGL